MTDGKILIVEDAISVALVHQRWLMRAGYQPVMVGNGKDALEHIRSGRISVVLLDLELPDMHGRDILKIITREKINVTVIVVTASTSLNTAVDAMREGAYDFFVKPASEGRVVLTVKNALERAALHSTVSSISSSIELGSKHGFTGSSPSMLGVYKTIEAVSHSKASVFITGESGTGKEVCAQAIHHCGPRKDKPFIALNCAAIPKELMESEIFGHLKGSFSGATVERAGAALAADGGTLFLDEICEMDLALQSKLLRFLQTGRVQKVGSDSTQGVDVRIICATNRDPDLEVAEGRFREDLYYRLYVVPIVMPPLRERGDDVLEIAEYFLEQYAREEDKPFTELSDEARQAIMTHEWSGNVRQLQNTIRQAVILNCGSLLEVEHLNLSDRPIVVNLAPEEARVNHNEVSNGQPDQYEHANGSDMRMEINLNQPFHQMECQIIEALIRECGNSIPRAAEILGLSPSTLYRKKESWQQKQLELRQEKCL